MNLLFAMPGGTEWFLIFIVFGIMIIPKIIYIITLQSTFDAISVENRKMPSGYVWFLLIPLFGIIWHFIVVSNLSDSIRAEANSNNINISESRPTYNIGLAMCILNCMFFIPLLNILTMIAGFICWIIYWVSIVSYKNILLTEKYTMIETVTQA